MKNYTYKTFRFNHSSFVNSQQVLYNFFCQKVTKQTIDKKKVTKKDNLKWDQCLSIVNNEEKITNIKELFKAKWKECEALTLNANG